MFSGLSKIGKAVGYVLYSLAKKNFVLLFLVRYIQNEESACG